MSNQHGQRVVGWSVEDRSAWVEEIRNGNETTGFVAWTRDGNGVAPLGEFCFVRGEAETIAKTFVGE